jgi:hypothetical protein
VTNRRSEAGRQTMRRLWADPEAAARMRANLEKGRGWNRGTGKRARAPDPPAPPADPHAAPPPAADPAPTDPPPPARRSLAAAVLTSSPRDLLDKLRGR